MASTDLQTTREQIEFAFAQSIFAKTSVLQIAALTQRERARLKEAIAGDIRKTSDLLCTVVVSKAAHREAEKIGVDLRQKAWHDQPKFDRGRRVFHFEHMQPVSARIEDIYQETSPDGVLGVLRRGFRVAWILKSEDRELTRLGYRATRPEPDAAYRAAGMGRTLSLEMS